MKQMMHRQHRKACQAVHDLHQHVVDVAQVRLHRLQQQRRLAEHGARARELHGAVHLAADDTSTPSSQMCVFGIIVTGSDSPVSADSSTSICGVISA
jgi:hypothetical protein